MTANQGLTPEGADGPEGGALPRRSPCGSCPYRVDVPPGVWDASEYGLLPMYDGDIGDQVEAKAFAPFYCHQADGRICSGWLGVGDPVNLLAVRIGIVDGRLDPSCVGYLTRVRLHSSHGAAAAFGLSRIENPPVEAREVVAKILRSKEARGER